MDVEQPATAATPPPNPGVHSNRKGTPPSRATAAHLDVGGPGVAGGSTDDSPTTAACSWGNGHQGELYEVRGSVTCLRLSCAKHLGMVVREVARVHGKAIVLSDQPAIP